MSQSQLEQARQLILSKNYPAAKAILETLDDPTAKKWLQELNRRGNFSSFTQENPTPRKQSGLTLFTTLVLALTTLVALVLSGYAIYLSLGVREPTPVTVIVPETNNATASIEVPTPEPILWQYLGFEYSQRRILGDPNSSYSRYEFIVASDRAVEETFANILIDGCEIEDYFGVILNTDEQLCIAQNFQGREFFLNRLGLDGWELIAIENVSTEFVYQVNMIFKRPR